MDAKVSTPALDRYITLADAARALRSPGVGRTPEIRLRRYLLRRERVLGTTIMIRFGTPSSPRYRLTLSTLRAHCPELFDTRVELTELLREHVEHIDERLEQLQRQDEALARALSDRDRDHG